MGGIAVDTAQVYWVFDNQIFVKSKSAPADAGPPTEFTHLPRSAWELTLDRDNVYWQYADDFAYHIATCPKSGCPASGPVILASEHAENCHGIAVDDAAVYWVSSDSVMKVAK